MGDNFSDSGDAVYRSVHCKVPEQQTFVCGIQRIELRYRRRGRGENSVYVDRELFDFHAGQSGSAWKYFVYRLRADQECMA